MHSLFVVNPDCPRCTGKDAAGSDPRPLCTGCTLGRLLANWDRAGAARDRGRPRAPASGAGRIAA